MGRDEIVSTMAAERGITHPDDLAYLRRDVERVVDLYEQPHRWCEADGSQPPEVIRMCGEVKPHSGSSPD